MAWLLYFISLVPLFIFLVIKYFDLTIFTLIKEGQYLKINYGQYAFIISVLSFVICIFIVIWLRHRSKSGFNLHGAKITTEPQNINHELIGVLSAVVLPFLTVNFNSFNDSLASVFVLFIIGMITTRSTIYYKNPVLAILKLKIYQLTIEHSSLEKPELANVISFYDLKVNDSLYLKELGEKVYYAKRSNN